MRYDIPLLGDITGLDVVHLQCHIGTDTLSLARRGAKSVTGLDLSPESLKLAKQLAESAAGGENVSFMEGDVYSAPRLLGEGKFDLVFTGIGALCWLPDIKRWAETVAALLKPGGQLFIREGHPLLWALDDKVRDKLVIDYPYFETKEPLVYQYENTYVELAAGTEKKAKATKTVEWNHGMGETVGAVLGAGMRLTGLVEHQSIPWQALRGQMVHLGEGMDRLARVMEAAIC